MGDLVLICARGGSKGVPGKNLRPLAGIPLIGWPINTARQLESVARIVVSTDSESIAATARELGADTPFMRPSALAQDSSPEWPVWQHAIIELLRAGEQYDRIIVLPATAPLRRVLDVERCLDQLEDSDTEMVITVTEAQRSPWFNMVKLDEAGRVSLVNQPEGEIIRRQDAPEVFDMTTVAYVTRPSFVLERSGVFDGVVRLVEVPRQNAVDIDTELDFLFAEFLLQQQNRT